MRHRIPELLKKHEMTAYRLAADSGGRISLSVAYRLARGEFRALSPTVLDALCEAFGISDPGPLLERDAKASKGRERRAKGHSGR